MQSTAFGRLPVVQIAKRARDETINRRAIMVVTMNTIKYNLILMATMR